MCDPNNKKRLKKSGSGGKKKKGKKKDEPAAPVGGDLMSDLFSKLKRRRNVMSGTQTVEGKKEEKKEKKEDMPRYGVALLSPSGMPRASPSPRTHSPPYAHPFPQSPQARRIRGGQA